MTQALFWHILSDGLLAACVLLIVGCSLAFVVEILGLARQRVLDQRPVVKLTDERRAMFLRESQRQAGDRGDAA